MSVIRCINEANLCVSQIRKLTETNLAAIHPVEMIPHRNSRGEKDDSDMNLNDSLWLATIEMRGVHRQFGRIPWNMRVVLWESSSSDSYSASMSRAGRKIDDARGLDNPRNILLENSILRLTTTFVTEDDDDDDGEEEGKKYSIEGDKFTIHH
jgi:hypothetical protein